MTFYLLFLIKQLIYQRQKTGTSFNSGHSLSFQMLINSLLIF